MTNKILPYEEVHFVDTTKPVWNYSLFTDEDIKNYQQGSHYSLYKNFGNHALNILNNDGYYFSVWAPNATSKVTPISIKLNSTNPNDTANKTVIHLNCGSRIDPAKSPLIIVDGKELSNESLKLINPNNIQSISVLKNKEALHLYGDKAKDGVIIILLKKPPIT